MFYFLSLIFSLFVCVSCTKESTKIIHDSGKSGSQKAVDDTDSSFASVEGTINGGGGKGVLCRTGKGEIIEILDFYEARLIHDLVIEDQDLNQEQAIELAARLLSNHFWTPWNIDVESVVEKSKLMISSAINDIKFITEGKKLKSTKDSFEPLVENGCEIVQIAVTYDESVILVDKTLWDRLDWLNRVALITHELYYFVERLSGVENSISTRRFVGYLFSAEGLWPIAKKIPLDPAKRVDCILRDSYYTVMGSMMGFETSLVSEDGEKEKLLEFVFISHPLYSELFRRSFYLSNVTIKDFHEVYINDEMDFKFNAVINVDTYSHLKELVVISKEMSSSHFYIDFFNYKYWNSPINGRIEMDCEFGL